MNVNSRFYKLYYIADYNILLKKRKGGTGNEAYNMQHDDNDDNAAVAFSSRNKEQTQKGMAWKSYVKNS